ncbi:hypothetical protein A3H22_01460 [Candidatus Peribacteria bacterium RIFCSPLOWO2_12_FULL_55_15]|nr:MAG: hypothetical protein A2789_01660 [Candidatus Peribacteria bacterium RIFCSPHIGHO2_01_FULL_54_22]OGJ62480.1 MAG: hypothetical protein A3D12_04450 [Candidatus Peribacteria bacterium RIFCSPHIGHO2_02_FULL_55_24]OGJ64060.1 MAG: hypothetical protein A3E47_00710 [Candidatus Peribacteria bacterium RIFCSPHIGHO2_12_FULL_54_10]OGJ67529.1 MAG: hypothetical protein A2947_02410 [Candidatus Peribacteria bacterium RIFCSPLOWO2_01_FULL_54_110]OGJ69284.1 MAG: hypothetical protein A3H90_02130 [Candidatus Pe
MSPPSRILLRLLCNLLFIWGLTEYAAQLFLLTGGLPAILIIGFLLTAIDLLICPFLTFLTFPLRLFLSLLNILVISGLSLGILVFLGREFSSEILTLTIIGGVRDIFLLIAIFSLRDTFLRFFVQ